MSEKIRLERGMRRLADDELMHYKYVKRVLGKNGKYRYYYDNTGTSIKKADVKPTIKSSRKSTTNSKGKHSAAIAAAQAAAQNTPMYQLKHGNLKQKVIAGYKIVNKFINKLFKNNIKLGLQQNYYGHSIYSKR